MFKNVATKLAIFAFDTTTGAPKTGDAANLTAYVSKDYGAVTVLADTSATEMDATNAKGWYLFDLAQTETNADALLFTGKSSTASISLVGQLVFTTPANFTATSINSSGQVDVIKLAGQTVTAAAGVTFPASVASPTNITAGTITTVTNVTNAPTAGDLTATMKTSVQTVADAAVTANTLINAIAGYLDTEIAAIKAKTDNLPASPAAVGSAMALTAAAVDDVLDEVVEGTTTFRQMLRGFASALMGKASGLATTTAVYRDIGDTKDRLTATVDADGNRTAVTRDLT